MTQSLVPKMIIIIQQMTSIIDELNTNTINKKVENILSIESKDDPPKYADYTYQKERNKLLKSSWE